MKNFTLLVDGKDLDTGHYEYAPYMDKAILEFKATHHIMTSLKQGEIPPNANEYIYAKYSVGNNDTNLQAIDAAHKASKEFKYFTVSQRLKILSDIHKYLVMKKDEFIKLLVIEGHPRKLAEWEYSGMECAYRKESLDFFKDQLWKQVGCNRNETIYWARKPDGVVTVSPPKNASASNSLTAAFVFLGGNTLIVKPPLRAPIATIFLWKEIVNKALEDNKAPSGTLNIILGNSKHITDQWISSPKVNDIYMFGDSKMGLEIGRRCYEVGKKPILELSGNDSLFVWKECDVNGAVESSIDAFLGSTQICMVPKTIVVHQDIYDTYIEKLLERISQLKYGLPSDDETYFTPVIKVDDFFIFLEDAKLKGASVLCGGNRVDHTGAIDNRGAYVQPTVVSIENYEKALEMLCVREENFFPLLPVMKISSDKQGKQADEDIFNKMIAFARLNEYGLRASAWVSSFYYTRQFIKHLDNSGLLRINSRHVNFSSFLSTHGGTGKSGGPFGEMSYIWQKTTHLQGISLTRERRRRNVGNVGIERRCLTP